MSFYEEKYKALKKEHEELQTKLVTANLQLAVVKGYLSELYSGFKKEITINDISSLMESHRYLRNINIKFRETLNEELSKKMANIRETILETEYISIDKLMTMTLNEIVKLGENYNGN